MKTQKKCDPTNPSLHRNIPLAERVKHLLRFGENKNGRWLYRFATHPRFAYWALNMIQRKRIQQQQQQQQQLYLAKYNSG